VRQQQRLPLSPIVIVSITRGCRYCSKKDNKLSERSASAGVQIFLGTCGHYGKGGEKQGVVAMTDSPEFPASGASDNSTITLPVYQEQLQVSTRTVETGKGVRVKKSVTEQPHQINQALLHDEVVVKRVAGDQTFSLADAPGTRYEGETLIVPVLEEILVIERRVRLKEEIHITKIQREEQYSETVLLKSEEVSIERFDEASEMQRK
jgi:uncharacterized protein (TIGR02271 family)